MWPRNFETCFGLWLAMSPFIFGHGPDETAFWATDFVCATLIVLLSVSTYWKPMRRAHLFELVVAAWLMGFGWLTSRELPPPPAAQNHIIVGLLVAMFAIIPSQSLQPSAPWREFRG